MASMKSQILNYLDKRVGQVVHVDEIAAGTGLLIPQVQACVASTRYQNKGALDLAKSIQVVTPGYQWIYKPVPKTAEAPPSPKKTANPRCFEEVGTTKNGALLIRCDDGTIWKAEEL